MRGPRENQYTDVGVVGRKTGLTVGTDLALDEDGMEDASAFFSPPAVVAKRFQSSPLTEIQNATSNSVISSPGGFIDDGAVEEIGDERTMEIDENSGREPREVLASRRKAIVLPRRTTASTSEHIPDSPLMSNNQDIFNTSCGPQISVQSQQKPQPPSSPSPDTQRKPTPSKTKNTKARSPPAIPADIAAADVEKEAEQPVTTRNKKAARSRPLLVSANKRTARPAQEESFITEPAENELCDTLEIAAEKARSKTHKGNITRGEDPETQDDAEDRSSRAESENIPNTKRTRKGRAPSAVLQDRSNIQSVPDRQSRSKRDETEAKPTKKRGRPARNQHAHSQPTVEDTSQLVETHEELSILSDSPRDIQAKGWKSIGADVKKKSQDLRTKRRSATSPMPSAMEPSSQSRVKNDTEPKKSKPGRKRKVLSSEEPPTATTQNEHPVNAADKRRKIQHHVAESSGSDGAPADSADGAAVRRSQRSRIAPLQFWKNERRVFTFEEARTPSGVPSVVQQVLRVEDTPVKTKKRPKKTKAGQGPHPSLGRAREESAQPEEEEWEETGTLLGMVKCYSLDANNSSPGSQQQQQQQQQQQEEEEIAVSRRVIVPKALINNNDYKFYKTLGKEFMGAGILELDAGSFKRMKSSGRMQLVFYVVSGKVEAVVNELSFRVGAGSQFQVPRGNMYQISNPFQKTAKIFFAQACIPEGYSYVAD